jgi:DNA-binding CsgD family transcriptional regulator
MNAPLLVQEETRAHHHIALPQVRLSRARRFSANAEQAPDASAANQLRCIADIWHHIQALPVEAVDQGLAHLLERLGVLLDAHQVQWAMSWGPRARPDAPVASQQWPQAHADANANTHAPAPLHEASSDHVLSFTRQISPNTHMTFTLRRAATLPPFDADHDFALECVFNGLSRWLNWLALSHGPWHPEGALPVRLRQVLLLLATHRLEKQIASALGLSENTTHQYVTAVYRRFGVRNRPSLLAMWLAGLPAGG